MVFEYGYLIGKLGCSRVATVVKGEIEEPNDFSGLIYISMNDSEEWKTEVKKEIRAAGCSV